MSLVELIYSFSLLGNRSKHRILIINSGKTIFNGDFVEFVNQHYLVTKANNMVNKSIKQFNVVARDSDPVAYNIVVFVEGE